MSNHSFRSLFQAIARPAAQVTGLATSLALGISSLALEPSNAGILTQSASVKAPATLAETGLYSDPGTLTINPELIAFAPSYPLWTDGAEKRRWISIPPGDLIDTSNRGVWDFPVGTRLWKEFSFDGQKVETRYIERLPDGSWLFASYGWSEDGKQALLVSEKGRLNAYPLAEGRSHTIPSGIECRICHLSGPVPVLGFSAQQLANDSNSNEPRAGSAPLPQSGLNTPHQIAIHAGFGRLPLRVPSPTGTDLEREALGYLHGNCGHCHNTFGPLAKLGMDLRLSATKPSSGAIATTVGQLLKSPPAGLAPGTVFRIAPGQPHLSAIPQRMGSRRPSLQMPPLGTALVDAEGIALINRWIAEMETVSFKARHTEGEE